MFVKLTNWSFDRSWHTPHMLKVTISIAQIKSWLVRVKIVYSPNKYPTTKYLWSQCWLTELIRDGYQHPWIHSGRVSDWRPRGPQLKYQWGQEIVYSSQPQGTSYPIVEYQKWTPASSEAKGQSEDPGIPGSHTSKGKNSVQITNNSGGQMFSSNF